MIGDLGLSAFQGPSASECGVAGKGAVLMPSEMHPCGLSVSYGLRKTPRNN